MLFNSYEYLFLFLPIAWATYWLLLRHAPRFALPWLTAASIAFYGYWHPPFLVVLGGSLAFNYGCGRLVERAATKPSAQRSLLALGMAANLALLGYYKYSGFLVANLNDAFGLDWSWRNVALPLGISFFTFQQMTYLHDMSTGKLPRHTLVDYVLFVTFFPQLIAGPIVHPNDILPQLNSTQAQRRIRWSDISTGLTILSIGLFKKLVIADRLAEFATPLFQAADRGYDPALLEAWGAALAYSFQLYFDFSGYSDMALGSARLFAVRLPANFHSPYRATSIIDFWRRWHITLSRFLRDYVYFSLGGSRGGFGRKSCNLLATMTLGGLWHGAGWNYVLWGAYHGLLLAGNHAWRALRPSPKDSSTASQSPRESRWTAYAAAGLTFLCVTLGWVLFRAESLAGAGRVYAGMAGLHGCSIPPSMMLIESMALYGVRIERLAHFREWEQVAWIAFAWIVATRLPNTQQWLSRYSPTWDAWPDDEAPHIDERWTWKPAPAWTAAAASLAVLAILSMNNVSEFLYFQF